jgi:2-keto-3-deoxy-L-arabinonate dehydratase
MKKPYAGVYPVAPTIFDSEGRLDLEGQKRCIDFMIDAGSDGICILANWSEQFTLTDDERSAVMLVVLGHVGDRVPVIVTTTHTSSLVCARRCRSAEEAGAAMVMVMPPYHGATMRFPEKALFEFFRFVSASVTIPLMVQDAPMSGTSLPVSFLVGLAREIPNVRYFKIEVPQAAAKIREMIRQGGELIEGPWDGEEGITLYPDLEAGITGTMTGAGYPDGIRRIYDPYHAGRRQESADAYMRWLPLINYENRQCGLQAAKILMEVGGVIKSGATRHPLLPLDEVTREGLVHIASQLDPLVLRWAS